MSKFLADLPQLQNINGSFLEKKKVDQKAKLEEEPRQAVKKQEAVDVNGANLLLCPEEYPYWMMPGYFFEAFNALNYFE